ncbi:MAG: hypothetical protein H7Y20_05835 [Bryobacteraceae bacterium]|nr:hypothetical protein [Bryobacteraceae bacterium]
MIRTKTARTLLAFTLLAIPAFSADGQLINLVPAEAAVIGGIHVDRTAGSQFGQFVLSHVKGTDKDFEEFVSTTGFDPRRDVREIVFASLADAHAPGLVLARGVFNGPQILAAAKAKSGGTSSIYKGVNLLDSPQGKTMRSLGFIDGSLAIAGDSVLVRATIDRRNGTPVNSALVTKALNLSNSYDAWMATSGVFRSPVTVPAPGKGLSIEGIVSTSGGLTFDSIIRFTGEAVTRSDKDALALVDVIRFLSSMVQMNSGNQPGGPRLQPLFESLQARADANVVKLSFAIAQADLERMMELNKEQPVRASR